jgi:hypothetical protein
MVLTMDEDVKTEELLNLAAVMILGASELTDELTDVEARSLIDSCLAQADAAVDALIASHDPAALSPEDAGEMIAERVAPVRRYMGAVNALVGKRRRLTTAQMLAELNGLQAAAEELPQPPETPISDGAMSLLAHWPTEGDSLGFMLALLHVFEPGAAARSQTPVGRSEMEAGDDRRREQQDKDV